MNDELRETLLELDEHDFISFDKNNNIVINIDGVHDFMQTQAVNAKHPLRDCIYHHYVYLKTEYGSAYPAASAVARMYGVKVSTMNQWINNLKWGSAIPEKTRVNVGEKPKDVSQKRSPGLQTTFTSTSMLYYDMDEEEIALLEAEHANNKSVTEHLESTLREVDARIVMYKSQITRYKKMLAEDTHLLVESEEYESSDEKGEKTKWTKKTVQGYISTLNNDLVKALRLKQEIVNSIYNVHASDAKLSLEREKFEFEKDKYQDGGDESPLDKLAEVIAQSIKAQQDGDDD